MKFQKINYFKYTNIQLRESNMNVLTIILWTSVDFKILYTRIFLVIPEND